MIRAVSLDLVGRRDHGMSICLPERADGDISQFTAESGVARAEYQCRRIVAATCLSVTALCRRSEMSPSLVRSRNGVNGVDGAGRLQTPLTPRRPNTTSATARPNRRHPVNAHQSCRQFPLLRRGSLAAPSPERQTERQIVNGLGLPRLAPRLRLLQFVRNLGYLAHVGGLGRVQLLPLAISAVED